MRRLLCCFCAAFGFSTAAAQNTGGVIAPGVAGGHRAVQYRMAFAPGEGGTPDGLAQRLHYEQSLDGDRMARLVVQTATIEGRGTEFAFVQGELLWELSDDADAWKRGLRFDLRLRDNGGPHHIGLNFANQWALTERLSARLVGLTALQLGEGRSDGIALSSRAQLAYRLDGGLVLGVESYDIYGSTSRLRAFDRADHQVGPFVSANLGEGWQLVGGALFGVSGAARDTDLRVWFGRSF